MPVARVNDIDLYYEEHGEGPHLALIEGTGYHTWMWYRQLPALTPHFRVLIYDNRGVGRSDKPPGPYSHEQNADDLVGLLDFLGWDRTHVLGISMGGFIAQEFALKYPGRLDALVLVATAFGGPHMAPVPAEAIRAMLPDPNLTPEERIRRGMRIAFSDPTWPEQHPEEFEQIVRWRLEYVPPPEAAAAQVMAGATFNTEQRLGEVTAPTLIVAGDADRVVPARNAELLAERIPAAELAIMPGGGHLAFIDHADQFNQLVLNFLTRVDQEARV